MDDEQSLLVSDWMGRDEALSLFTRKNRLKFSKELESAFRDDYLTKSMPLIRISFILGIVLYSVFGILDIYIAPATRPNIWLIRFAIVCPIMIISLLLTLWAGYKKIFTTDTSIVAAAAGFGIIAMIAISKDSNVTRFYYAGLILVIMWAYTFTRLRFIVASIICWLIVIGYEFAAVFVLGMLGTRELLIVFINNNFFFIAANVMGMVVCFIMERYARVDFINRRLISEKQDQLQVERNELFEKNRMIRIELELAKKIQQHIIPQTPPRDFIYAIYKPMEEVGGDYFDFVEFEGQSKIGIFLSDVSGHGVPAAFIATMIKSIVVQAQNTAADPARLLSRLNQLLINMTDENFITAFYGIYDYKERTFLYASAGHNPPYVCIDGKVATIKTTVNHVPIGFLENDLLKAKNKGYKNYRVALPQKAKLVLYTDGLTEARSGEDDSVFYYDEIENTMLKFRSLKPIDFVNNLYQDLVKFRGSENFDDDICLICLEVE